MSHLRIAFDRVHSLISKRPHWLRTVVVVALTGAVLVGSVASVTARRNHTIHFIAHYTTFVTTQKDPNVFAPGEQLSTGGTLQRFDRPQDQVGTVGISCTTTGFGGSELLCNAGIILADGKISFQMLIVQPDEPIRYAAITGGTGAYRGASGEATGKTLSNGDEVMTFYLDD